MYLKVHCQDFCYIGNQLYVDRMTGNIKYHSDLRIFYVIKKIAMFLFRRVLDSLYMVLQPLSKL